MLSAKRDNLTSLFPICMPFIYFSCLNALTRTSSTLLNRSGESGHPLALNFIFINPTPYSTSSPKFPIDISKLTCLPQSSLFHPKMFQLKFSSHLSVGLLERRKWYSWHIFFPHSTSSPLSSSTPGLNKGGRRGKVAGKTLPDYHVSLAL